MKRKEREKSIAGWTGVAQEPGSAMPLDEQQDTSDTDDDAPTEALRSVAEARVLAEQMPQHYRMADVRKGRATRGSKEKMPRMVQSPSRLLMQPTPLEVSGAYSVGPPPGLVKQLEKEGEDVRNPYDALRRDDDAPMNEQCLVTSLKDWPMHLMRDPVHTFSVEDRRMAAVETLEREDLADLGELMCERAKLTEYRGDELRLRSRLNTDPMVAEGIRAEMREAFVAELRRTSEEEAARYCARVIEKDGVVYNDTTMPRMSKEDRAYNRAFLRAAVDGELPCAYGTACIGRLMMLTPGATADMSIGDANAQPLRSYYAPHELEAIQAKRVDARSAPCIFDRRASTTLRDMTLRAAGLAPPCMACDTYVDPGEYPEEAELPVLRNTYAETEGLDGYAPCECIAVSYGGLTSAPYRTVAFLPNCYQQTEVEVPIKREDGRVDRVIRVQGFEEIMPLFGLAPVTRPSTTVPNHGGLRKQ